MDLSVLGSEAQFLAEQIEKFWNKIDGIAVKINLIQKPTPGYYIDVDQSIGDRAFVRHSETKMQLHNYGRIRSIFHEFGHILGLKDYYYTSWNAKACNYLVEYNPGDIMSGSESGDVLPVHWQMIKDHYQPQATPQ